SKRDWSSDVCSSDLSQRAQFFLSIGGYPCITSLTGNERIIMLKLLQLFLQNRDYCCLLLDEIMLLFRISNQIVKLGFRTFDVMRSDERRVGRWVRFE